MDSPDSPGRGLIHSLNAVVSWLHSEGFYAAGKAVPGGPCCPTTCFPGAHRRTLCTTAAVAPPCSPVAVALPCPTMCLHPTVIPCRGDTAEGD